MEILVSVIILALVIAGMANLFVSGKRWLLHSRSRMAGAELGKLFVEPLQAQVRQDKWNTSCVGVNNCSSSNRTLDNIVYNANYTTSDVNGTNLRRAQVTINWTETPPQ